MSQSGNNNRRDERDDLGLRIVHISEEIGTDRPPLTEEEKLVLEWNRVSMLRKLREQDAARRKRREERSIN